MELLTQELLKDRNPLKKEIMATVKSAVKDDLAPFKEVMERTVRQLDAQEVTVRELEKAAPDQGDQKASLEGEVASLVAAQGTLREKVVDEKN
ncbi:hypothetical protein scyTo_0000945 [Scyliorhinus torazame]|uniref:Uncharacterized protein n=1 Tax=Scyliorhinus torazame TaxID=75743 RepID=A0A401P6T2_SCYTO|nr:hypothetical protein [Scyliorhinus torazame]